LHARERTDYVGLNGLWLNNACLAGNTRTMLVFQDGYRVEKLVTYSLPACTGDIFSMQNTGAWSYVEPIWLATGVQLQANAKYNMRLRMKAVDDSGWTTQFINRWGDNLSTMFNNYWLARVSGNQHYTRIRNINTAE
jgi:hypothetical protein